MKQETVRKMKKIFNVITMLIVIAITQDTMAQQVPVVSSFNIKAMVIKHITLTSKRDLDFGLNIYPGLAKSIDKSDASAGKFSFLGQPNREISIKFTLPSKLFGESKSETSSENSPDNTGSKNSLIVKFSSNDASCEIDGKIITFNPTSVKNTRFGNSGKMDIYLGGTLLPVETQTSGYYSGLGNLNLQYITN